MTQQSSDVDTNHPTPPPPTAESRDLPFRISVWAMIVILILRSPANLVVLGWFTETYRDTEAASEVSHRLHEVAFGIFFSLALVGAISQITAARRNLAGLAQLSATLVTLAVVVTWSLGIDYWLLLFLVPLVGILRFYGGFRPMREGPIQLPAVLAFVLMAPAFLDHIVGNAGRAADGAQNHTTHWSVMAAFYTVMLLLGLIVTFRVRGYRLVAWSLGLGLIVFGAAALAFPYDASSHRPGYAVFLMILGGGWIIGPSLARKPREQSTLRRAIGIALSLAAIPFVLMVAGILVPTLDDPPNVPHRPNPNIPAMTAGEVDRNTCLECHGSGLVGAPVIPHEASRTCSVDEPCWGGRSDCAGCHRIDPALGGPTEQVFAGLAGPSAHLIPYQTGMASALSAEDLRDLDDLRERT